MSEQEVWILEDAFDGQMMYQELLGVRHRLRFFSTLSEFESALAPPEGGAVPAVRLLIADIKVKDGDFIEFLRKRGSGCLPIPFMIVSFMDEIDVLRTCFEIGALDYLTKPFTRSEFVVKTERILKALAQASGTCMAKDNPIQLDFVKFCASRGNRQIQLTPKEFQILLILLERAATPVSRAFLQERVWGKVRVSENTLSVHVFNLRNKLRELDVAIHFHAPDAFFLQS